jgi:hypothetical protein
MRADPTEFGHTRTLVEAVYAETCAVSQSVRTAAVRVGNAAERAVRGGHAATAETLAELREAMTHAAGAFDRALVLVDLLAEAVDLLEAAALPTDSELVN